MDYTGLDYRNIRYAINRPLEPAEESSQYHQGGPGSGAYGDLLSVIRVDGVSMELVDRWYSVKGFNTWLGAGVALVGVLIIGVMVFLGATLSSFRTPGNIVGATLASTAAAGIIWAGWTLVRTECFRWTHYPVRLNRKMRLVHVFRQDGTVLTTPWDDLFIFRGESSASFAGKSYDVRAHVLADDRRTVLETFTLGYGFMAKSQSVDGLWNFLRRYMEEDDGVSATVIALKNSYLMPLDRRKEGWRWSVIRTFAPGSNWPLLNLLLSIPLSLTSIGRIVAMATSKVPVWSDEVLGMCETIPADEEGVNWKSNPDLPWKDAIWPFFCLFAGCIAVIAISYWLC